jgi:signal transduction histidine kinase
MRQSAAHSSGDSDQTAGTPTRLTLRRQPRFQFLDIRQLIDEIVSQLSEPLSSQNIAATLDVPRGLRVLADDRSLRTAVFELALNAVQSMPDGGDLVITAVQGPYGVELEIADSGPGLPDAASVLQSHRPISAPDGMDSVREVLDSHGARLTAVNCPEGGAAFTLQLPLRAARAAA